MKPFFNSHFGIKKILSNYSRYINVKCYIIPKDENLSYYAI